MSEVKISFLRFLNRLLPLLDSIDSSVTEHGDTSDV